MLVAQKSIASFFFLMFAGLFSPMFAQVPSLLKDINTQTASGNPRGMTTAGNTVFFSAIDGAHGRELWKTTGTDASTVLVKDINPNGNSNPANFCNVNGTVFFTANDAQQATELWKTDGTAEGTKFVASILLGGESSAFAQLTACNGKLFFRGYQGVVPPVGPPFVELKLFVSDGTPANTKVLANTLSAPQNLTAVGNTLFLSGISAGSPNGNQLLKTDGTTVFVVKNLQFPNETETDLPGNFINVNGTLFFSAKNSAANGRQIWKSTGTNASTVPMSNTAFGFKVSEIEHVNGTVFFSGVQATPIQVTTGDRLFRLNAQNNVTEFATAGTAELTAFDGRLVFTQIAQLGSELSRVTVAGAGITTLKSFSVIGKPTNLLVAGTNLFFVAGEDATGRELWKNNSNGTVPVQDFVVGPSNANITDLCAKSSDVFFASSGTHGNELRRSDGSINAIATVKNIGQGDSFPKEFVKMGSLTFFSANDGTTGRELWKTDGTTFGTQRVADIASGSSSSDPTQLIVVTNGAGVQTLFFEAKSPNNGRELYKLENTLNAIPTRISDIAAEAGNAGIGNMTDVNGTLHFTATQNVFGLGDRIYKVNAARTGVEQVGGPMTFASNLKAMGTSLFFTQSPQVGPRILSKIANGQTTQVKTFQVVAGQSDPIPQELTVIGSRLFFTAADGFNTRRVWVTNAAADNAIPVSNDLATDLTVFNGRLVFTAPSGIIAGQRAIFRVNLALNGVEILTTGSAINGLRASNTTLFFFQVFNEGLITLSKITTASNIPVPLGSFPGANNGIAIQSIIAGENLFFNISTAANGNELWKSNGTLLGTGLLIDIRAGVGNSNIQALRLCGTDLFFSADNLTVGQEPWKLANATAVQGDETDEREANLEPLEITDVVLEIKVYPNPAVNFVNVELPEEMSGTLSIISASGQLLRSVETNEGDTRIQMDVQDLARGIYMVRWVSADDQVIVKTLILQ